jgi:plasmid stabilization system protein ParE
MKPARLRLTPRARRNIEECIAFIARFPRGKPEERRREIYAAFRQLCEFPERHAIEVRRRRSAIALRRHQVDQFTIIYAYLRATDDQPSGIVSIRAVRHRRIADAFLGVREGLERTSEAATGMQGASSTYRTV